MLQDKSEDFYETWQFLDRRFEDVGVVGNTISTANDLVHGMSFLCTVYKFVLFVVDLSLCVSCKGLYTFI